MKKETLERELVLIAQEAAGAEAGGDIVALRARASILREAAGPKIALQGFLGLELLGRHMDGRLQINRLMFDICQAALDRWLGKAKQTVDLSVDHEFIELVREYREAKYIESPKSAIVEISVVSPIPPIVPPSPSGAEAPASSASTPQALLQAATSKDKQSA